MKGSGSSFFVFVFFACLAFSYAEPAEAKAGYGSAAIDQANNRIFALNKDTEGVDVLDVKSGALITSLLAGVEINALALDEKRGLLAVGGEQGISIVSTNTLAVIATIPHAGKPVSLASDPAQGNLLIVTDNNRLLVADLASLSVTKEIVLQDKPVSIAVDAGLQRAVVAHHTWGVGSDGSRDNVSIVDLASLTISATILAGKEPTTVAVNSVTHEAAVVNEKSNDVTIIDLATLSIKGTVPVGKHPAAVAYNNCLNTLAVVGGEDKSWLQVIDAMTRVILASAAYQNRLNDVVVHDGLNRAVLAGKDGLQFYALPNPVPQLNVLSPSTAVRGSGAVELEINGAGLLGLTEVYLNGTRAESTFKSCGGLAVTIPDALVALAGNIEVKTINSAPQGGTSNILLLQVVNPVPSIAVLQPSQADAGSPDISLTIIGSGFFPNTALYMNNAPRAFTYISATTIKTQLTASELDTGRYVSIVAINPQPGGGSSPAASFTVLNPAPSVTSLAPTEITAGSADMVITIAGGDFVRGSSVLLNGLPVTTRYVSKTSIEATIVASSLATPGSYPVAVNNPSPGGGLSTSVSFQVKQAGNKPAPLPAGSFGKQYEDLVPSDATIKAYDPKRLSIATGLVMDRAGNPISGVNVTIHGHAEYGSSATDIAGRYSLPLDGGTTFTMVYEKTGLITSHRQIYVPWNDIAVTETVTLLVEDAKSTTVVFDGNPATIITHRSTPVTDSFGIRAMTMVFTGDNRAYVTGGDGQESLATTITTRATEFDTPESMPAKLPPTSAYTYCAELSVDGAKHVRFEKPVITYVENFLGFPVGEIVPVGYYDRAKGTWIASDNGVVVRLLDTNGDGIVDALDSNGDGLPNDLNGNGSFIDEVAGLSNPEQYMPGKTFWRVSMNHFSPWDENWSAYLPEDAISPDPYGPPVPDEKPDEDCDDKDCTSSFVERQTRIFHEDIGIAGTDLSIHYSSSRVDGYKTVVTVPVSGSTIPPSLSKIVVSMNVAGRLITAVLPPQADQKIELVWDGKDYRGNPVFGQTSATVSIGYGYRLSYESAVNDGAPAFGKPGRKVRLSYGAMVLRQDYMFWKSSTILVKREATLPQMDSFGSGWSLSSRHYLAPWDPNMLMKGDGTTKQNNATILSKVAGNGGSAYYTDNVPAISANIAFPNDTAVDSTGSVYFISLARIRKVYANGLLTTVAGNGQWGYTGDGGQAKLASLESSMTAINLDSKDNLYIATGNRVRKVDANGIITTVAGDGYSEDWRDIIGDGGPAVSAKVRTPRGVATDNLGNMYISSGNRVRKVDTNGTITTIAGSRSYYYGMYGGDGGPANQAMLNSPGALAVDSAGNLYIADVSNYRIRKVNADGIITTIAGIGYGGFSGDGGPASQAQIGSVSDMTQDSTGNLYLVDGIRIRKIDVSGIITTVAGDGQYWMGRIYGEDGPPRQAYLSPKGIAVNAAGDLYIADRDTHRVVAVSRPAAYKALVSSDDILFVDDGGTGYIFSSAGLHKSTIATASGKGIQSFEYDGLNRLASIIDRFGNRSTIQRDSSGKPISVTSPDGLVTDLTIDGKDQLRQVAYPDGSSYSFSYTADGLMTDEYDQRNSHFHHDFDQYGRVTDVFDPEGGHWNYTRSTDKAGVRFVSVTTGEDNVIHYRDQAGFLRESSTMRTTADGSVATTNRAGDGYSKTIQSCGMTDSLTYDIDSVYKLKYVKAKTTTSPTGLAKTIQFTKAYQDWNGDKHPDQVTEQTTVNGKAWTTTNNSWTGLINSISPLGRITSAQRNPGNMLLQSVSMPGLLPTVYGYDDRGRLKTMTNGTRTTTIAYDSFGNYDYILTPENRKLDYTFDNMGRMNALQQPDGSVIQYDYDLNGNLNILTNAKQVNNTFDYTANDQRKSWTTPLSGNYRYSYDKERKLKTVTFPSGKVISNTYAQGLLTATTTPEGTTSYSYGCAGKLSGAVRGSESIALTFDGTLITTDVRSGTMNQTIGYSYNNDFNLTSITYAGESQMLGYDNDRLLTSAAPFTITRNAQNGLPEVAGDGALALSRTFNGYGELDASTYTINGNQLYYWNLTRDNAGKITQKADAINGNAVVWSYTYDALGRLRETKQNGTIVESYEYDANGNRTFETNTFRGTSNLAYTLSLEDHLLTAGQDAYRFDQDGFLTSRIMSIGTTTFTYSSRGELLSAALPDGRVLTYDHDPMGRRIAKRVNGAVIEKYLWQGMMRLLAVYDGSNNLVMRFTYADGRMPVSMSKGGATYYLFYDQLGSLRAVADSNGTIIKEQVYDSFGYLYNESNPSFLVPFGFAGGLYDKDADLIRFGARDYDPTIGRWTAKDPIDFAGGDANLFGYVKNNPVRFIDPQGNYLLAVVELAAHIALFIHDLYGNEIWGGEDKWMKDKWERDDLFKKIDQLELDIRETSKRLEEQIRDMERRKEWERENGLRSCD